MLQKHIWHRILCEKEFFIFDKDGTVVNGKKPIPGARDFLKRLHENGKKFVILTNNSSMPNEDHARDLGEVLQYKIGTDLVYSSLDHLIEYLKRAKVRKIYPFLNAKSFLYVKDRVDVEVDKENPELIVVGFFTEMSYKELKEVSLLIQRGCDYILVHPDFRCPTDEGYIPDAGSFGKVLEITTQRKPKVTLGKPNPEILDLILKKFKFEKEKAVFIGDRLYTDIKMGMDSGITTVLILTGETKIEDVESKISKEIVVVQNFAELTELVFNLC